MTPRSTAAAIRYLRGPLPADRVGRVARIGPPGAAPDPLRLAADLDMLAHRIRRNIPLGSDPSRFHEEKSEIAGDIARIAEQLRGRQ